MSISKATYFTILLAFVSTNLGAQNDRPSRSQNRNQLLNMLKEDMYVGGGINLSGVYTSKYRNHTLMSMGAQGFLGLYFPYTNNLFFHGQLGISSNNFVHKAQNETLGVRLSCAELPVFVSALLPLTNRFETRLILGWQGNWVFQTKNSMEYSEDWASHQNSIMYTRERMMRLDFGFYFGLGAEYGRWLMRVTGFVGTNNLVKTDTGMLNVWKVDIGYFIFRK